MERALSTKQHKQLIKMMIAFREKAGLTQSDLAEKLDQYQSFVARLESGQHRLDVIEFLHLADILDFDEHEVLKKLKNK